MQTVLPLPSPRDDLADQRLPEIRDPLACQALSCSP